MSQPLRVIIAGSGTHLIVDTSSKTLTCSTRLIGTCDCTGSEEGNWLKLMVITSIFQRLTLSQNGIDYVVFDKESSPRDRNWGVTIAWSHPYLEELLPSELYGRLPDCQPDPKLDSKEAGCESVIIRDGSNGKTMVEPPFPRVRRLNIQKTRRIWSEGINVKVSISCFNRCIKLMINSMAKLSQTLN